MSQQISLKQAERKAFQANFQDGLVDIMLGCFSLQFAIAPLLSDRLGDFWSSAIFLPFLGVAFLIILLLKRNVVRPRLGIVKFGPARTGRMMRFTLGMLVINVIALILGTIFALRPGVITGITPTHILGIVLLIGFSAAGYFLDFPRLYLYGLLIFIGTPIGEWLYTNYKATHHGFPIVFGSISALMILTGLALFVRFLNTNPIPTPEEPA